MWDFADDGQLYCEKAVNTFIKTLFARWAEIQANHTVSIIFFSRTFYDTSQCVIEPAQYPWKHAHSLPEYLSAHLSSALSTSPLFSAAGNVSPALQPASASSSSSSSVAASTSASISSYSTASAASIAAPVAPEFGFHVDAKGRLYQDFYKVVIDAEQRENWESVVRVLKQEFLQYPALVRWGVTDPRTGLRGLPSRAKDGNSLEAMNLALNVCDKHYMDRDLHRTGW